MAKTHNVCRAWEGLSAAIAALVAPFAWGETLMVTTPTTVTTAATPFIRTLPFNDAGVRLGFLTKWRDEPASATLVFADGRTESLTLSARETRVVEGRLPLTRQGKPKEGF